ncbi:MAG: CpsD/CapB family tyrosine-protein kinase [Bradyrhizobium sp.]|nr:CpsD/CapB family tyrosine-protein kinase [Bradyrhizobium sp.]
MEYIRKAIERAAPRRGDQTQAPEYRPAWPAPGASGADQEKLLDLTHLEQKRIIAHDDADARSMHFHILRTQILQAMDSHAWQTLAVTSPTRGCQATETAINLAISIARQPDRSVVLVDLDLSEPGVANCLGLKCEAGVAGVLLRSKPLSDALIPLVAGNYRLSVLPNDARVPNSSEWLASRANAALLRELKSTFRSSILIFNIAPILPSDDAISILPQMDCALLVTAAGVTRRSEIKACEKYLRNVEVLRILVHGASSLG